MIRQESLVGHKCKLYRKETFKNINTHVNTNIRVTFYIAVVCPLFHFNEIKSFLIQFLFAFMIGHYHTDLHQIFTVDGSWCSIEVI